MAVPALTETEISQHLSQLPGWERTGEHANAITKTYQFDSYAAGLAFATAAGIVGEGKNHHPEILIGWKKVTLTFTTHDAGSQITRYDVEAAAAIEALGYPRK